MYQIYISSIALSLCVFSALVLHGGAISETRSVSSFQEDDQPVANSVPAHGGRLAATSVPHGAAKSQLIRRELKDAPRRLNTNARDFAEQNLAASSYMSKAYVWKENRYWEPTNSSACDEDMQFAMPSQEHPMPGNGSRRIAVLFWTQSFRGWIGLSKAKCTNCTLANPFQSDKAICAEESEQIQRASSKAHIELIVKPLESIGLDVHVFLDSQNCSLSSKLLEFYNDGRNLVKDWSFHSTLTTVAVQPRAQVDNTRHGAQVVLDYMKSTGTLYEGILIWRYDTVPTVPIVTPQVTSLDNFFSGAYDKFFRERIVWEGDIMMSYPGWSLPCTLGALGKGCFVADENRWFKTCSFDVNFDSEAGAVIGHDWFIYRGPLGFSFQTQGILRDCQFLQKFGGPSCDARDFAKLVCTKYCKDAEIGTKDCMTYFWEALAEEREYVENCDCKGCQSCLGGLPDIIGNHVLESERFFSC